MKIAVLGFVASLALFIAAPAHAGGPLSVCKGIPTKYAGAGTVTLNHDQGGLGSRSKVQADALVTEAISLWTDVKTATITLARGSDLPVDVTAANYLTYMGSGSYGDGLNPVLYDTDGSIIDLLNGVGAKNSILGFAGSAWYIYPTYCQYAEGRAVINGFIPVSDTTLKTVLAHEVGHLIGLDHTQLDSTQGLKASYPSNYPLMYPTAYRDFVSLHEDDVAAVSALYPDASVRSVYGQLSGTFTETDATPILGANLWAEETSSHQLFSIVSDYLMQNTGYFKLLLPAGTYTLHAESIQTSFTGGSSVGPYSEESGGPSFADPLYVRGKAMTPVTLGNGTPTQIAIRAGCAATAGFRLDGTGTVSGNCGPLCSYTLSPTSQSAPASGLSGTVTVSSTAACPWTAVSHVSWISGLSAGGNGTLAYAVAANTSTSSRTGTLTIAGQTFAVTQAGASLIALAPTGTLITRYRLYSQLTKEHMYTTDANEYSVLPVCCAWLAEGPIYKVFEGPGSLSGVSAVPYYRLYNPFSHQHHWTTDANEYNILGAGGWSKEGVDGYILPSAASGSVQLYRLYLSAFGGLHLWTTDVNEKNVLTTNAGWVDEGVAGYVVPLQ